MRASKRVTIPCALTIAGSDSGGGAGIQADLKTFAALGVHGTSALTCITAQNPKSVSRVQAIPPGMVLAQMESVFEAFAPGAVKTGMLFSRAIIEAVSDFFEKRREVPLVVDPVMVATSRARLLKPTAFRALCRRLLPLATLITPNLDEASWLLGRELTTVEELRLAARELHHRFGCAVLAKGGHLATARRGAGRVIDIFHDGRVELELEAPLVRGVSTHGTGCTMSSAVAAHLALGFDLVEAVQMAKLTITDAIRDSVRCGEHDVLWPFASAARQDPHA